MKTRKKNAYDMWAMGAFVFSIDKKCTIALPSCPTYLSKPTRLSLAFLHEDPPAFPHIPLFLCYDFNRIHVLSSTGSLESAVNLIRKRLFCRHFRCQLSKDWELNREYPRHIFLVRPHGQISDLTSFPCQGKELTCQLSFTRKNCPLFYIFTNNFFLSKKTY